MFSYNNKSRIEFTQKLLQKLILLCSSKSRPHPLLIADYFIHLNGQKSSMTEDLKSDILMTESEKSDKGVTENETFTGIQYYCGS